MRYSCFTYPDVNNGLGCRVSLWICGCKHYCEECHNKELWDFNHGKEFDFWAKDALYEKLSLPYIKGLTLTGGDPLYSFDDVLELCKEIKENFPTKDIWLYTGFKMDEILKSDTMFQILNYVDTIVDGKYMKELRDITLKFRGSKNQHIWIKNKDGKFEMLD